ncbi:hypothetical protein [Nocardia nova]|uniref:hypothetical protein n=1 Tax=Nocardia nova TaxID=37330 RepID=UPI0034034CC1
MTRSTVTLTYTIWISLPGSDFHQWWHVDELRSTATQAAAALDELATRITADRRVTRSPDHQQRCAYAIEVRWSTGAKESIRGHTRPVTVAWALRQEAALIRGRNAAPPRPGQPANLDELREALNNPLIA